MMNQIDPPCFPANGHSGPEPIVCRSAGSASTVGSGSVVREQKSTPRLAEPKVSILIPCYNAARWIQQAIQSALDQTWPNKEVVVVDDGSTDGSLPIIRSFGDAIRVETGPNRGGNVARNRLLELSDGEWVQYLDADDYLLPDKIERQMAQFDRAQVDVAYAPMILQYWKDNQKLWQERPSIPEPHDLWVHLVRGLLPRTGGPLWRRAAIVDVGNWRPDQPSCQEYELYLRMLIANKRFQFCPTAGAVYRLWSSTTVCRKDPYRTLVLRLRIIDAVEEHLQAKGELTEERRDAIAHGRIESARGLYQIDRQASRRVAELARSKHPKYRLDASGCFPRAYRLVYHSLGFHAAESIAQVTRRLRTRGGPYPYFGE
jgi:glycosyltransferase involved in cell wall biosynthesis